MHTNRLMVISL